MKNLGGKNQSLSGNTARNFAIHIFTKMCQGFPHSATGIFAACSNEKSSAPNRVQWASIAERGSRSALRIGVFLFRLLGRRFFLKLTPLCAAYYLLTHRRARIASYKYLSILENFAHSKGIKTPAPTIQNVFRHFTFFANSIVDKVAVWTGKMDMSLIQYDTRSLRKCLDEKRGAIVFSAHAGNVELMRGVAGQSGLVAVNALMFTKNAERFNDLLKELNPESGVRIVAADSISVETAVDLEERIAAGECVAVMADRVSVGAPDRTVKVDFLGSPASFPEGPFILAALLACPVHICWSFRNGEKYEVVIVQFSEKLEIPRRNRKATIQLYAQEFARALEQICLKYPLQWYNFYDFWE